MRYTDTEKEGWHSCMGQPAGIWNEVTYGWDAVFMRNTDRESGRYDIPGVGNAAKCGYNSGGRYKE
jgi:hypothetical protein